MTANDTTKEGIWVGRFQESRNLFVYDPAIQEPESAKVFIYGVASGRMRVEPRDALRAKVEGVGDALERDAAFADYRAWCRSDDNEREQRSQRKTQIGCIEIKHEKRLRMLGLEYAKVRIVKEGSAKRRITHCYNCKLHLDNRIDIECCKCGWIICDCGACGCGYVGATHS